MRLASCSRVIAATLSVVTIARQRALLGTWTRVRQMPLKFRSWRMSMSSISNQITLRSPTPKDVPVLARICYEAFKCFHERHAFPPDFPSVEMATQLLGMMTSHPRMYGVVAEVG